MYLLQISSHRFTVELKSGRQDLNLHDVLLPTQAAYQLAHSLMYSSYRELSNAPLNRNGERRVANRDRTGTQMVTAYCASQRPTEEERPHLRQATYYTTATIKFNRQCETGLSAFMVRSVEKMRDKKLMRCSTTIDVIPSSILARVCEEDRTPTLCFTNRRADHYTTHTINPASISA